MEGFNTNDKVLRNKERAGMSLTDGIAVWLLKMLVFALTLGVAYFIFKWWRDATPQSRVMAIVVTFVLGIIVGLMQMQMNEVGVPPHLR